MGNLNLPFRHRRGFTLIHRNKFWRLSRKLPAFTLIELLVVISIIGLLITLIVAVVGPIQRKSRDTRRKSDINLFLTGLDQFKFEFKVYPNYTMYLGSYGTSGNGAENSNFGLADAIPQCNGLSVGQSSNFTSTGTNPTAAQLGTDGAPGALPIKLKEGQANGGSSFSSANNFLVCLRYMDRVISDVNKSGANGYQVRFSYDYSDVLVSAELESTTDPDAKTLYNGSAPKRYYQGSGTTIRQLDEDSNTSGFYNLALSGSISDGLYLFQCVKKADGTTINLDDRSSSTYDPITYNGSAWAANSACRNVAGDAAALNVVKAF